MTGPAKRWMWTCVFLGVVRIAASLSFVWVCKELVDIVTGVSERGLYGCMAIMLGIMVVQLISGVAYSYCERYGVMRVQLDLRETLFSRVMSSEWTGRERFGSGDAVNRLEEDIRVISELMCIHVPGAIITLVQLVAASVYLLMMAPGLMWVLLVLMVAAVVGSRLFFWKLRSLTSDIRSLDSDIQQLVQENLQNRVVVLTLIGVARVVTSLEALQSRLRVPAQLQRRGPRIHVVWVYGRLCCSFPLGYFRNKERGCDIRYDDGVPSACRPGAASCGGSFARTAGLYTRLDIY